MGERQTSWVASDAAGRDVAVAVRAPCQRTSVPEADAASRPPRTKAKPAPMVAICGTSFVPSVMRQLEAGQLLALPFGEAVFAIPRERHAATRAVVLASKTRRITREEAVAALTALAHG